MKNLLLAVDIGNTNIECGIFKKDKLLVNWRLSSPVPRTADEMWQLLSFFCKEAEIDPNDISSTAISSVVPSHTGTLNLMCALRLNVTPLIISVATCPFIKVHYNDPEQIGADRLCNAVAGFELYGGPLVVVDFGTAITLDVIDAGGVYLGGVILPGPQSVAALLHTKTAQLPRVSMEFPETIIGLDTKHGIQSGLTWGMVDMVDGLIERIGKELKSGVRAVATGGDAPEFARHSRLFNVFEENLVLYGIRLIFNKWSRKE